MYAQRPEDGTRNHYSWWWVTMWFSGIELRTGSALNNWAISPAHVLKFQEHKMWCGLNPLCRGGGVEDLKLKEEKKSQRVKVKLKKKKKTHIVVYLTKQLYCLKVAATFPVFGGLILCLLCPLCSSFPGLTTAMTLLSWFSLFLFMAILKTQSWEEAWRMAQTDPK